MELFDLLEKFMIERDNLSESTLEHYQRCLYLAFYWLDARDLHDPRHVSTDDLRAWLGEQTWCASTKHVAIAALKNFFRWAIGQDSPAEALTYPKRLMTPQRTLTRDQVETLLSHLDTSRPKGVRDLGLICLLLDTGLRSSEICRLELADTQMDHRSFFVRIKGGRVEGGVFGLYTQSALYEWLNLRGRYAKDTTLFVSLGGLKPGTRLTRYGLQITLRALGIASGIGVISPHDFRRTFATLSLKGGAPTRLVQLAGRWKSVREVERYSQTLTPQDFEPYSPVNRIMGLTTHGPP